jgi:AcrR family transcriptional regulator
MKRRLSARKEPQQGRAQQTVQAIVDAATYILIKDGWQGFTTNRIAKRAGVNIASLYQYFPNKEAIAVEIQRLHGESARRRLREVILAAGEAQSLRSVLRETILAAVEEHTASPRLHKALSEELPRSIRQPSSRSRVEEIAGIWKDAIAAKFNGVPDAEIAVFISRVTIHAVIHAAAVERPGLLTTPLLTDELVALLEGYLQRRA